MHDPDDEEARQHRGIREVEAESVALMIDAAHGMDTAGYTIPYVSTWAARVDGQEPVQMVQATGERVRKTALAVLDQLDTLQVGDGTPPGLEPRQHLTIDTTYIPDAWADVVTQAQPGQLAAGTTAVTIEATRHRAGVWNGQPVTSEHPVAFTVFVVCAPTYPTCQLLRLSQLDNPLR